MRKQKAERYGVRTLRKSIAALVRQRAALKLYEMQMEVAGAMNLVWYRLSDREREKIEDLLGDPRWPDEFQEAEALAVKRYGRLVKSARGREPEGEE